MLPQLAEPFEWIPAGEGPALVCHALDGLAEHIFTTRAWSLGSPEAGADGWRAIANAMRVDDAHLVRLRQVHGSHVVVARSFDGAAEEADIVVSNDPGLALAIKTADCVPILIADRRTGAAAGVHAGWRGLAARAPEAALASLADRYGSRPEDLVAVILPAIGACCYEVGEEVRNRFVQSGFRDDELARWFTVDPQPSPANRSMASLPPVRRPNHWFFDGPRAARDVLVELGKIPADQVHVAGLCTASHDVFCSYRRDGAKGSGRMVAAIRSSRRP